MWYILAHVLFAFVTYRVYIALYNLFIHPLHKVPGPWLYAVSWIPKTWRDSVVGKHYSDLTCLHERYGDVVRVGPDEVSCTSAQAWNDIYGHKPRGQELARDFTMMEAMQLDRTTVLSGDAERHRFFRKLLAPGFSDKVLAEQEHVIVDWGKKLVANLRRYGGERPVDLAERAHWATLDMMGVLTFSQSFGCLENDRSHRWLDLMEAGSLWAPYVMIFMRFSILSVFIKAVVNTPYVQRWVQSLQVAQGIATERLDRGTESRDVVSFMWNDAQESKSKTTREQVEAIAGVLCIAGTETGATTISGLIYWILSTPCAYERLTAEVRAIKQIENLTPSTLSTLPYLNACIREGLRLHSPVTGPAGRIIPKSGATVDGYWLPEGVIAGCPHWACGNIERNFVEPRKFLPGRWLADEDIGNNDHKEAIQPFGKGPMNCIGQKLATTEMQVMLAEIFWNFDAELMPASHKWVSHRDARCRIFRQKEPLMVQLTPLKRDVRG